MIKGWIDRALDTMIGRISLVLLIGIVIAAILAGGFWLAVLAGGFPVGFWYWAATIVLTTVFIALFLAIVTAVVAFIFWLVEEWYYITEPFRDFIKWIRNGSDA